MCIKLRAVGGFRKNLFFVFTFGFLFWLASPVSSTSNYDQLCPGGCYCVKRPSSLVPDGYGLKINCHPLKDTNSFPTNLPSSTIQLDLTKYGLSGNLKAEHLSSMPYLQKLDLQGNGITHIDNNAFISNPHLEVLELSRNKLRSVQRDAFTGLINLEKLKLNDNEIQTLADGSLDNLINLEKLDLSDNTLVCNCSLAWFVEWNTARPNLLANPSKLKCVLPIKLADIHIRKIQPEDMPCDEDEVGRIANGGDNGDDIGTKRNNAATNSRNALGMFEILPSLHQVAFQGDTFKISCKAELPNLHKVIFTYNT